MDIEALKLLQEARQALFNRDAIKCYDSGESPCNCTMCKIDTYLATNNVINHNACKSGDYINQFVEPINITIGGDPNTEQKLIELFKSGKWIMIQGDKAFDMNTGKEVKNIGDNKCSCGADYTMDLFMCSKCGKDK